MGPRCEEIKNQSDKNKRENNLPKDENPGNWMDWCNIPVTHCCRCDETKKNGVKARIKSHGEKMEEILVSNQINHRKTNADLHKIYK